MMANSVLVMTLIGFVTGVGLAVASRVFYVKEDPRVESIKEILPGLNCGGCGFTGCEGAAKAIASGKASANLCSAGGYEVLQKIMEILQKSVVFEGPVTAVTGCSGSSRTQIKYYYDGARNCKAEYLLFGGSKICENGCLGKGSCVAVCPLGIIRLDSKQYPVIDEKRCLGCGKCVAACLTGVLSLMSFTEKLLHFNEKEECLAPCQQKCPAQVEVPEVIRHIRRKEYHAALLKIKTRNPLVLSTGRVCSHPCENICRRNIPDEGVDIKFLTTPIRIIPDTTGGGVSYIEYSCVEAVDGKRGDIGARINGTQQKMKTALVISAYERKPDIEYLFKANKETFHFKASKTATLDADKNTLLASEPDIFTAGDMYSGRASVIDAVAGGRRAARSIHHYLTQGAISVSSRELKRINPKSIIKSVKVTDSIPKVNIKELPVSLRKQSFVEETQATITESQALTEAARCLQCGTICND